MPRTRATESPPPAAPASVEVIDRLPAVKAMVGLSTSTIYSEMSKGRFPRPLRLTGNKAVGWRRSEVQAWLQSRAVSA